MATAAPVINEQEITDRLLDGTIRGISVDTCIFDQSGLRLDGAQLQALRQFKGSKELSVVQTDIVTRELERHLAKKILEAHTSLVKGTAAAEHFLEVESKALEILRSAVQEAPDAPTRASAMVKDFFTKCGAEILQAHATVKSDQLLDRYFSERSPFETTKDKKSEFPDAFNVMALETWAEKKGAVLVVTADHGCQRYCEQSEKLYAIGSLSSALSLISAKDKHRVELARALTTRLLNDEFGEFRKLVVDAASDELSEVTWDVEAHSYAYFEDEIDEIAIEDVEIDQEFSLRPLNFENDDFVAKAEMKFLIRARCHFSLYVKDGIDRDMMKVGSSIKVIEDRVKLSVIFNFSGAGDPQTSELDWIELAPARRSLNFGEVEAGFNHEEDFDQ